MANKTIKDYPESTSPSGEWYVLVDDGTGCYYKVKLKNLPKNGVITTTSTTTTTNDVVPTTTTSSTSSSSSTSTTTTTEAPPPPSSSTTTSTTSSSSSSSTSSSSTTSTTTSSSSSTSTTTSTTTTEAATVEIYAKYVNQQSSSLSYSTDGITWTDTTFSPNTTECSFFITLAGLPQGDLYLKATTGVATISICKASVGCATCPGFTVSDTFGCPQVQIPITSGTNVVYITVDGLNCI